MQSAQQNAKDALNKGKKVSVSCGASISRTGTVLTCILISVYYNVNESIEMVKENVVKHGNVSI